LATDLAKFKEGVNKKNMPKTIKSITNPKLHLDILTADDVNRLHDATLHIIENVGIRFKSKRAIEIWEAHGAKVDHNTMIVKAKPALIEDALKKAPPIYPLCARDPQQDLMLVLP